MTTFGYLAFQQGVEVQDVLPVGSSVGLAFIAFPVAIDALPAAQNFFAVVFFLMLLTLGLDSAFSLVESAAAIIKDNLPMKKYEIYVAPAICLFCCLVGLFFTSRGGLFLLDAIDRARIAPVRGVRPSDLSPPDAACPQKTTWSSASWLSASSSSSPWAGSTLAHSPLPSLCPRSWRWRPPPLPVWAW